MPEVMLPPMFVVLLVAFGDCFTAPSYENFCRIVAGWVHCLGGVTVAVASGKVHQKAPAICRNKYRFACWQSYSDHFPCPSARLLGVIYAADG